MTAEERANEFLARGIPMGRWDASFGTRLAEEFRAAAREARRSAYEYVAVHLETKCAGKWSVQEIAAEIRALAEKES